jgi:hypothetical protein
MTKLCPKCKKTKTAKAFGYRTGDRAGQLNGVCKECQRKTSRDWALANPERAREKTRRYRLRHPELDKARWTATNKKRSLDPEWNLQKAKALRKRKAFAMGLSAEEFEVKDALAASGNCESCSRPASECAYGRLVFDHDHKTGAFRGIVCPKCNVILGMADESERILECVLAYKRLHRS